QPFELACSPEASSSTPAFCSSSWYFAISVRIFSCGMTPASESFVAFTIIMNRIVRVSFSIGFGLALLGPLRAHALLLLLELGFEGRTEVLRLEDLANLDLCAIPEGRPLDPLDRLFLRLHLPEPEAGHQLLRFGEGPVGHRPLPAGELHARSLGARLEALAGEQHAGFLQLLVELAHLGQDLLIGKDARLGVLVGLHQDHESHRRNSLGFGFGTAPASGLPSRRTRGSGIDREPSASSCADGRSLLPPFAYRPRVLRVMAVGIESQA